MRRSSNLPLGSAASAGVDFGFLAPGIHAPTGRVLTARPSHPDAPAARSTHDDFDYHPRLATAELIAEVRGLLATGRRTERLLCRYLADLADRVQARRDADLGLYADELEAAHCLFGLGTRETRERVRVGRALRHLPRLEAALLGGDLSYSRVREVTRVATAQTELEWLELGRQLDMRALERCVTASRAAPATAFNTPGDRCVSTWSEIGCPRSTLRGAASMSTASKRADRTGNGVRENGRDARCQEQPVPVECPRADTRRVTFELSSGAWELVERAMQAAQRATTVELSDGEALEAVARAALSVLSGEALLAIARAGSSVQAEAGTARSRRPPMDGCSGAVHAEVPNLRVPGSVTVSSGNELAHDGLDDLGLDDLGPDGHRPNRVGSRAARWSMALRGAPSFRLRSEGTQSPSSVELDSQPSHGAYLAAIGSQATQGGSAVGPSQQATQASTAGLEPRVGPFVQGDAASRLLSVMCGRQCWSLDALTEASGLLAKEVSVTMLLLELDGRVRSRNSLYEPV